MFPVLQTLIDDVKIAAAKLGQHLVDLGHEAEDDLTALLHQAEAAAAPVVQAAEADAEQLATEALTDAKDVAAALTDGLVTPVQVGESIPVPTDGTPSATGTASNPAAVDVETAPTTPAA